MSLWKRKQTIIKLNRLASVLVAASPLVYFGIHRRKVVCLVALCLRGQRSNSTKHNFDRTYLARGTMGVAYRNYEKKEFEVHWNRVNLVLMGLEQLRVDKILVKPTHTCFLGTSEKNACNTTLQHPHYFTVVLMGFRTDTEGIFNLLYT